MMHCLFVCLVFKGYLGYLKNHKRLSMSELNRKAVFEDEALIQSYLNWLDVSLLIII
jgi:hypothetical protein